MSLWVVEIGFSYERLASLATWPNREENKNDVGILCVISKVLRIKMLTKKSIKKYWKIFIKQVVAEFCIFFCLDLASDQSWAISFPAKKNSLVFQNLYKKGSLFFSYLLNQTSYIAAQKSKLKLRKCTFHILIYMLSFS